MSAMRHGAHSLSAFEAALPLLFTAAAIASLGWGANLYGHLHPAPAAETAQVPSTMSKRQEEKLAADMSAFALAKVAPERLVSEATREAFSGPTLPPLRLANVTPLPPRKMEKQPTKAASVLPPVRPALITSSQIAASQVAASQAVGPRVAAIAPPPAAMLAVPGRGVVARVAEYVPSPRQMFDGVRTLSGSLGDQVSRYIPRI